MIKFFKLNYSKSLNNLLTLLIVLGAFPLFTCKKFHNTIITGRLINNPIKKGISKETIVLKSIQTGALVIPEKAKLELTTITDLNGFYSFCFEAYIPAFDQRETIYTINWSNLSNKKAVTRLLNYDPNEKFQYTEVDLMEKFNIELASFALVESLGKVNYEELNVMLVGKLMIKCVNELPIPSSLDTCEIRIINQADDFYLGRHTGTGEKILDESNYFSRDTPPPLISGPTTLKAIIKKNNQTIIKDTSFFAEDKEYYFEFKY